MNVAYKTPPSEPLWAIFTPDVRRRLEKIRSPSSWQQFRLDVLSAGGLRSHTPAGRELRAYKAAWEVYLYTAFACGLFEGSDGNDLRARITNVRDDAFIAALGECLAAWYLAGKLGLPLMPRPEGRPGHPLEFMLNTPTATINVEVKSPRRAIADDFWWGDDHDALQQSLRKANKQFEVGTANLLVIVPRLRLSPLKHARQMIERAFIGETVISIPIHKPTGGPAGPATFPFQQSGDFVRSWPSKDQRDQPWAPNFTRVSAILSLTESVSGAEVRHQALMVHNPNAAVPLSPGLWSSIPQFARVNGRWLWSDHEAMARDREGPSLAEVLASDSDWLTNPYKSDGEIMACLREFEARR